jgi:hypothetical protein
MNIAPRRQALERFYAILDDLEERVGGRRRLVETTGRSGWPKAGVYFFFEDGEYRATGGSRVVRVGTHALTATSKTTLWTRLRQHRGTVGSGGNHRGSIFRLHVGTALLARGQHPEAASSWARAGSATTEERERERPLERAISAHIGVMPMLWVAVDDRLLRARIEQGAIALVSNADRRPLDPASVTWLGHDAARPAIRSSHTWNVNHVTEPWSAAWIEDLAACTEAMR